MNTKFVYIILTLLLLTSVASVQAQSAPSCPVDTIDGQLYYRYTVERSIGLYRLSINFGVKQEDILKTNPQLRQQGLRYGEVILIPTGQKVQPRPRVLFAEKQMIQPTIDTVVVPAPLNLPASPQDSLQLTDTTAQPIDSLLQDSLPVVDSTVIRLGIMLPLQAKMTKREKNIERFYDFYAGVLIALYEAQARGHRFEVYTYDTGRMTHSLPQILAQPEIPQLDAIIGPTFSKQLKMVVDSVAADSTWVLVPFISQVPQIADYPYILQFNPSDSVVADTLARYLAQMGDSINCVLVEAREGDVIPASIAAPRQAIDDYHVPHTTVSVRALLSDSVEGSFVPDKENILIFNTEKYANLYTVMPHLHKIANQYPLTLFTQYSWQGEQLPFKQLYTSIFAPAPMQSEQYEACYRQYFNHELATTHPRYDLLGYDLTSHLLHLLVEGKGNTDSIMPAAQLWQGVQSDILYLPVGEQGGYVNHHIHIIHQ